MTEKPSRQDTMPGAMPGAMPVAPGDQGAGAMPMPSMGSITPGDPMPRPGGSGDMTASAQQAPAGAMPQPSAMQGGAESVQRFATPGSQGAGRFRPGVIEVQFREGVLPHVTADGNGGAPALYAYRETAPGITLADVNQILQRYQLVSAEPTFERGVEEATEARATALQQGIDVPHLRDFVTLHFPADANVAEIAAQLSKLPQVEQAVPVPTALPPADVLAPEAPPEALRPAREMPRERRAEAAPLRAPERELVAPPVSDPMIGSSDQVVVNPSTGLEYQWYVFRCRANQAWSVASGTNVVIADVDWGCRTSHQDLAGHIGRTYNAYDGSTNVTSGASRYHGTGVLGLAGAMANGIGMAGISFDAELWPVQADSGTGTALGGEPWARGIDWVRTADSGGRRKVVILEVQTGAFGNYEQVPSVNTAIKTAIAAGVVVCVAAGNGDRDAGFGDDGKPIPATGSILVGATSYDAKTNPRAWFSNYGPNVIVAAPGDSAHDVTCDDSTDSAYRNNFGGTSGATPKVAAAAALMLSVNPNLTHDQIRSILNSTGGTVTTDAGKPVGRFLNADAAVRAARQSAVGRLEVFARGTDKALWHIWQTAANSGWSGWASLGGWVDIIRTARNADGRLEVFARGSDGAVWHRWQTAPNDGWSGWSSLGGWVDLIEVARNQDGRLELFGRGSDGALWHNWQTAPSGGWSGWSSLGGWIDRLAVANNQDGRIEVFARGSDNALWHIWQSAPNNGWSGWSSLGGWIDLLDVGNNADGRLEVFARGSDRALWHIWQTAPNDGWSGWSSLGGWIDQLAVGSNQDKRLEVFARGSDAAVWHIWQTAPDNGWSGWASLGGWVDRIAVSNNADGRIEVFARGSDRALWHQWQTAPNNGWSGWASLGGVIDMLDVGQNAA